MPEFDDGQVFDIEFSSGQTFNVETSYQRWVREPPHLPPMVINPDVFVMYAGT